MWDWDRNEKMGPWKWKGKYLLVYKMSQNKDLQIQIGFGFCKGDDNFGGRKRKELDDFCKSLGKQMNLVMYRMEDTERLRTKLREDWRMAVREKSEMEELKEKSQLDLN